MRYRIVPPVPKNAVVSSAFERTCARPKVRTAIARADQQRWVARRKFAVRTIVTMAIAVVPAWLLGWAPIGFAILAIIVAVGMVFAKYAFGQAAEELKQPFLEELGREMNFAYQPRHTRPPGFVLGRRVLFADWLSAEYYSDHFSGKDDEGSAWSFFEADLERAPFRIRNEIFKGQVFSFKRKRGPAGKVMVVPSGGATARHAPPSDMRPFAVADDADFNSAFRVYGTSEAAVRAHLTPAIRSHLIALRQGGQAFAYLAKAEVCVAGTADDLFELGPVTSAMPAKQRLEQIYADVEASLATLKQLKSALAPT